MSRLLAASDAPWACLAHHPVNQTWRQIPAGLLVYTIQSLVVCTIPARLCLYLNTILTTVCTDAVEGTVSSFRSPPATGDSNLRLIRRSFPQGILMRMRTAASNPSSRSYFMSLYNPAESDAEDAESYQRHLADALHIDRALKVMNLNCSSVPLNKRPNSTLLQSDDSMLPFCSALLSPVGRLATTERRPKPKVEGQSVSVAPIK